MKARLLGSLALLACLAGCSSRLTVTVETLDKSYWVSPRPLAVNQAPELFDAYALTSRPGYKPEATAAVAAVVEKAQKNGGVNITPANAARLRTRIAADIDPLLDSFRTTVGSLVPRYLATFKDEKAGGATDHERIAIVGDFRTAQVAVRETERKVRELLVQQPGIDSAVVEAAVAQAVAAIDPSMAVRGDSLLSLVISAPAQFWHGPNDQVHASTYFGNGDIAFKAVDAFGTNFTLKGVKLDASKAIAATINVTRAAVQTIAAIQGIPVPRAAAAGSTTNTNATVAAPAQPESNLVQQKAAELKIKAARADRVALLDALIARSAELGDTDATKRGAAVDALLKDYGALFAAPAN